MRKFRPGVAEQLKHYVYRLVDPRNGETFYVGKGTGNRVFDHVNGIQGPLAETEKLKRITSIRSDHMEPFHVIHRHGLENEDAAYLVEAALMDAYPGLTNAMAGHGANEFGPARASVLDARYGPERVAEGPTRREEEIPARTQAPSKEEIPLDRPVVTIKITDRWLRLRSQDVYETVRGNWIIGPERLMTLRATPHHALAILRMTCIAAYAVPELGWEVNRAFKGKQPRCRFTGERASEQNWARYVGKRYSDRAQWPVRLHGF